MTATIEQPRPLLTRITSPAALRALPAAELPELARQLRRELIGSVAASGGHFAAGLGVVELTVALHRVFDTPHDRLVWDVGHQTYPHKILTGRRERMTQVRRPGGPSGFPSRDESPYDAFGVAHAGTSISAALGMSCASRLAGERRKVVAVIGDGALTAGMAYEALNQAGDLGADLLVVLNDNQMSISPNVGSLKRCCARLHGEERGASAGGSAGGFFQALGFDYYGPVDGHDVTALVTALQGLAPHRGPRLLHVLTRKGYGFPAAESNPVAYHSVSGLDLERGVVKPATGPALVSYTQVFGDWLCDAAACDPRLVAITPAMREGSGLCAFASSYPERFFDAGIAEQHALTLGAGFACEGYRPVLAIYSSFLQRAYDQLIHDIALQNLPVLLAIDRGGLAGADGATHHGSFDLSFLRCIPRLMIMAPADENECRQMLHGAHRYPGPAAVRYPRGHGAGVAVDQTLRGLPLGRAQLRRRGRRVALLSFGSLLDTALAVATEIDASVINMRFVKPLDGEMLQRVAGEHELVVTLEDNAVLGGAGSAVNEYLQSQRLPTPTLNLGLPDRFVGHGSREQLLSGCGLDRAGVLDAIARARAGKVTPLRRWAASA